MSVIYLVLIVCLDAACEDRNALIQERFVGETVEVMEECVKLRDQGRAFYSTDPKYADAEVVCRDLEELAREGFVQ